MAKIFLCHASEDNRHAEPIQLALSSAGHEVFYDENSLPPGGDYHERIYQAIKQCDLFVFLVSRASIDQGKYTVTELKFAREKWPSPVNRVLPVSLENIPIGEIPPYLTAATILTIKGNPAAEVRASAEALLRIQDGKRRKLLFTLFIALGAIAIGNTLMLFRPPGNRNTEDQPTSAKGYIAFTSEDGDYIGQGKEYNFSDKNGALSVSGNRNSIRIDFEGDDHWSFDFAAPQDQELQAGEYPSAQRAAFHNPTKPGIDVSGAGRGCNTLTGSFEISQIVFSTSHSFKRFVAKFEQHCEEANPKLSGVIDIMANDSPTNISTNNRR
jgi:TIR domain